MAQRAFPRGGGWGECVDWCMCGAHSQSAPDAENWGFCAKPRKSSPWLRPLLRPTGGGLADG